MNWIKAGELRAHNSVSFEYGFINSKVDDFMHVKLAYDNCYSGTIKNVERNCFGSQFIFYDENERSDIKVVIDLALGLHVYLQHPIASLQDDEEIGNFNISEIYVV